MKLVRFKFVANLGRAGSWSTKTRKMSQATTGCCFTPAGLLYCLVVLVLQVPTSVANGVALRAARITEHPTDMTVARNDPVTLKCSADGNPAPTIEWYRDGELIISSNGLNNNNGKNSNNNNGGGSSHRVMLPGGDLFFFRVVHGRKESDAGVYWCLARNPQGSSRSRNATLTVAYLHPEFRTVPLATRGILGESATLECEPPRGHPEPQVRWKKNGQSLDLMAGQHRDHSRIRMDENGNLIFAKLMSSDEGRYQCSAQNVVATRETAAVLLSVHVRPVILRPPQDATALLGGEVTLECGVTGDPPPHVEWRRQDGAKIPVARIRSATNDQSRSSLRLERLVASDAGRYVCEVENSVGSSSASAQLVILIPPTWNSSAGISSSGQAFLPREVRGYLDQSVYLDCPVHGSPSPLVFWQREGQGRGSGSPQPELFSFDSSSGSSSGINRWNVFRNGTLVISRLRREDAGGLWCGAVSEAGGLVARTRLEIVTVSTPPPPVIEVGPANQTLPLGSPASLACSATEPASQNLPLRWWKDGAPLALSVRMTQSGETGTLRIEDLQPSDAGVYTCWIGNGDRAAAWTATLAVASQTNPNIVFSRSPSDPMALPGSPSQPRLLHKTANTLTIGWQSGSRMGASPLLGYTVELFSSSSDSNQDTSDSWTWAGPSVPIKRTWRIITRRLKADQLVLTDLLPTTSYSVLVRAENSHGLSLPSPVSPWFTTLPSGGSVGNGGGLQELEEGRQRLSSSLAWLRLEPVRPLNATTVRLSWRWLDGADSSEPTESAFEGLHIWYRPIRNSIIEKDQEAASNSFRVVTLSQPAVSSSTYTLANLLPTTRYLFFLVPFYRNVDGRPSNSQTLTTLEAAPEGPPRELLVRQLNSTSCLVKWSEPPPNQRNGVITGYQIYVFMDDSETLLANMTLPPTPTSVIIGNLVAGLSYSIRAAAWTLAGVGPASDPASFTMEVLSFQQHPQAPTLDDELDGDVDGVDPYTHFDNRGLKPPVGGVATPLMKETWIIVAIGVTLLAILCLFLAVLFIRRRWIRNKAMSSVQKSRVLELNGGSVGLGEGNLLHSVCSGSSGTRDLLWSRGWHSGGTGHHPHSRSGTVSASQKEAEMEAQNPLLAQQPYGNSGIAPPEYAELLNQHSCQQQQQQHQSDQSQLSLSSFLPRRNNNNSMGMLMQAQMQAPPSAYATTTLVNPSARGHGPYSSKSFGGDSSSGSYIVGNVEDRNAAGSSSNSSHHSRKNSNGFLSNNGSSHQQQRIPNWADLLPPPPRHPPPPSPAPNNERSTSKDGSLPLPASVKPSMKFNSANPSPALSKRSAPAGQTAGSSTFKPPSPLYHVSLGEESGPIGNRHQINRTSHSKLMKTPGQRSAGGSHTEIDHSKGYADSMVGSDRSYPTGSFTASMNYQQNPLENVTTDWDDDVDDDYSRSISGRNPADDDDSHSDGTDLASSVYDNSPVVYRPPRGKPPSQAAAPLPRRKQMMTST